MTDWTIRSAEPTDIPQLIDLCRAHAAYEQATYNPKNKPAPLADLLFSTPARIQCLVVTSIEGLLGYATFMRQYTTWDAAHYTYLDCIYLRPQARGQGIGEKLMQQVAAAAIADGSIAIQWQTPMFNQRAMKFYDRLGAVSAEKARYTLPQSAMHTLVNHPN